MKKVLRLGTTVSEQQQVILENSISIEAVACLIDMSIGSGEHGVDIETTSHALTLIQRLSEEISLNNACLSDTLRAKGGE